MDSSHLLRPRHAVRRCPVRGFCRTQTSDTVAFDSEGRTAYLAQAASADVIAVDAATGEIRASSAGVIDDDLTFGARLQRGCDRRRPRRRRGCRRSRPLVRSRNPLPPEDHPARGRLRALRLSSSTAREDWCLRARRAPCDPSFPQREVLWRRSPNSTRRCNSLYLATATTVACGSYQQVSLLDLTTGETDA